MLLVPVAIPRPPRLFPVSTIIHPPPLRPSPVCRTEEIRECDIGTGAGLFEVVQMADEFFTFVVDCKAPKACTVLLRGASRDILNEVERNLVDAMGVARNICIDPRLVPGGGACEMAVSRGLSDQASSMQVSGCLGQESSGKGGRDGGKGYQLATVGGYDRSSVMVIRPPLSPRFPSSLLQGTESWAYKAVGQAMEVIPRTLTQNCGANVIRTLTKLRAKHADEPGSSWGINGDTGDVVNMKELGIWEPLAVKVRAEGCCIGICHLHAHQVAPM